MENNNQTSENVVKWTHGLVSREVVEALQGYLNARPAGEVLTLLNMLGASQTVTVTPKVQTPLENALEESKALGEATRAAETSNEQSNP